MSYRISAGREGVTTADRRCRERPSASGGPQQTAGLSPAGSGLRRPQTASVRARAGLEVLPAGGDPARPILMQVSSAGSGRAVPALRRRRPFADPLACPDHILSALGGLQQAADSRQADAARLSFPKFSALTAVPLLAGPSRGLLPSWYPPGETHGQRWSWRKAGVGDLAGVRRLRGAVAGAEGAVGLGYYAARVAVITGAGSGIGRALAVDLAGRGARLALSDQDADAVRETARRCRPASSHVRADAVDVTDRGALLRYPASVLEDFGRVDLVFCVAGVIHTGSLLASDFADIDHVVQVNLFGVVNTAKAFLPHMIASGGGQIVIFSSGLGLIAAPRYTAYNASKFAVRGFSESLRQEMALDGHPVSVTCVYPGGVRTPIMRNGRFAAGEDAAAVTATFDGKIARMDAARAASIVLRGVERGRARVLVGADAHVASLVARAAGSGYQYLLPWLWRRARSNRY